MLHIAAKYIRHMLSRDRGPRRPFVPYRCCQRLTTLLPLGDMEAEGMCLKAQRMRHEWALLTTCIPQRCWRFPFASRMCAFERVGT